MTLGIGNTEEFGSQEFALLNLQDERLNKRGKKILDLLQINPTSCVRRMSSNPKDRRQAYDFFFQPQGNQTKINGTSLR